MTAQQPTDAPHVGTVLLPGAIGDRGMSRSTVAQRDRAPRPRHAQLTPPFDGYPYLVTRIGHSALRHFAVLPTDWSAERLVSLTRRQALANRLDTCLVLGP